MTQFLFLSSSSWFSLLSALYLRLNLRRNQLMNHSKEGVYKNECFWCFCFWVCFCFPHRVLYLYQGLKKCCFQLYVLCGITFTKSCWSAGQFWLYHGHMCLIALNLRSSQFQSSWSLHIMLLRMLRVRNKSHWRFGVMEILFI